MSDRWLPIPGCPGYEASAHGEVRGVDRILGDGRRWKGRQLRQQTNRRGYKVVQLGKESSPRVVHHLVLLAFVGPPPGPLGNHPNDWTGEHKDGNKANNDFTNLEWLTMRENLLRGDHRRPRGQAVNTAKLTPDQIVELRNRHAKGERPQVLRESYGISDSQFWAITSRRSWKWL